ncbi:MAG TPA: MbtH family NRPS accessory protein [Steroidobacteraceae bacterium]
MAFEEDDDTTVYLVLVNEEEQYSLWPKYNDVPKGWKSVKEGNKAECLAYVKEVWTDMRPLSLRKHMEQFAREQQAKQQEPTTGQGTV